MLDWLEIGGPPVDPPLTKGYGTKFINAIIERQLDGTAIFDWGHDGLHCTLSIPLDDKLKLAERANGGVPTPLREHAVAVPQILVGNRLLLVEDEALVAMALERIPIRQSHIRRCGSNLDIRLEGSHRGRCRCLPKGHRRFGEPFFAACF